MKRRFISWAGIAAAMAGALLVLQPAVRGQGQAQSQAARVQEEAAKPTPRTADGHPDLTGFWANPTVDNKQYTRVGKRIITGDKDAPELDEEQQPRAKARMADRSRRPPYKPQFIAKQREMMLGGSLLDPGINCNPQGVPRIGAPTEIVQTPTAVYLMYGAEGATEGEDETHTFRVVPIGGQHDPERDPRPDGDSIARWEGDTLVIDVVNLDENTWLDGDGDFHDENLHVVERFTRKGNTLQYEVIIEDPTLMTGQWKPAAGSVPGRIGSRTRIARKPGEHVIPDFACVERDHSHKVNTDRF